MKIILYTNDCPKCKILKLKLDEHNISYEVCSDTDLMIQKGFRSVPVLDVDGTEMTFLDSVKWLKELYGDKT